MKGQATVMSHDRDDWGTPRWLFKRLDDIYHFDLDVCASAENTCCPRYFDKGIDGLAQAWGTRTCYMNPPYSRVSDWVSKAILAADRGAMVVCLVAARTDTRWFWALQARASAIFFIKGRLRFEGAKSGAPFPSAIVMLRPIQGFRTVEWVDWKEV